MKLPSQSPISQFRNFPISAAIVLIALLGTACAASRAYRRGQHAERADRYAEAVRNYSEAAARKPQNPAYRIALSSALIKSGEAHLKKGEAFERGGELELAYKEYCDAFAENPLNDRALLKRDILHKRLLAEAESPRAPKEPPIPSPLDSLPKQAVTLTMSDAELSEVFLAIQRTANIDFIFDETFKSRKVNVNFQQTSFRDVLDRLCLQNRLFYKPIDARTILVAPDTEGKRQEYEEQLVKTFYLHNADVTKVAANIKSLVDFKRVMVDPELKAITIRDTSEKLEFARRLIEKEDMSRAEVVVEMEILELNRNRLRSLGLDFSSYSVGAAIALDTPSGNNLPSGSLIRGHMLGNLELSDVLFSIPSAVYRLLRTDTHTKLIARPQMRSAEGETVTVKVGERVPIPVTTFVAFAGGGVNNTPIVSFSMTEVGLTVELKPTIYYNNEIQLVTKFELTSITREGTVSLPPTLGNRSVQTTIRLKDGETTLIAGLIKEEERHSRSGIPGIANMPILGHLFSSNQDGGDESDIIFSITPHIVRLAEIGEDERRATWVGTEHNLRISDDPPPFLTREPSPPAPTAVPESAPSSPEGTPNSQSPTPNSQFPPPNSSPQTAPAPTSPATRELSTATISFDPLDIQVAEGVQFSVRITARGSVSFATCAFDLTFDGALLDVVSVEQGRSIASGFTSAVSAGRVSIKFDAARGYDGTACRIIFLAKSAGSTELHIENARVTDHLGLELQPSSTPAPVKIGACDAQQSAANYPTHTTEADHAVSQ